MAPWPCSACQRRAKLDEAEEHRRRGNEHFKAGRLDEAVVAYGEAIRLRPKEGAFWLNRSIAFRQKEDWERAELDAARAAELQPGSEKAAYGRAMALQKLGRNTEAKTVCNAFLKSDPDNKALLQLRRNIEHAEKLSEEKLEEQVKKTLTSQKAGMPRAAPLEETAKKQNVDYSKWNKFEDSDDEPGVKAPEQVWQGKNPSTQARLNAVEEVLNYCRSTAAEAASLFANSRVPENVQLPVDYRSTVGILTTQQLAKFDSKHTRQLVAVYGDIFDVSSRPDQYGFGGPLAHQTGRDITWAVITGKSTPANFNRFFDIFKLDDEHCGRYLHILCQKMVAFENEFGDPIGRLENFVNEQDLPPAPTEEIEECKQQ